MSGLNLQKLPPEILFHVVKHLDLTELRYLMLTCKFFWHFLINESSLWKYICREKLTLFSHENGSSISYYNRCRISHNWCKGIFKSKLIVQHATNFMPWMQLISDVLILSVGRELKCYLIDNNGLCRRLLWTINVPITNRNDIRTNDISRFIVRNNNIVCGNRDGCTSIYFFYDIHNKPQLLHYIENCHVNGEVEVTAVEVCNRTIITASNVSPFICMWSSKEMLNMSMKTVNNIDVGVQEIELPKCVGCRSLAMDPTQTKLAIGPNGNSKPLLVDINTSEYLMVANSERELRHVIRDIQWHQENGLIYVTHSGKLQYIDIRTLNVVYETWDPFQSSLYCLKNDNDKAIVVGSSEYSRCVLFDLRSPTHVQMYFTQKKSSPIYSLDFDVKKLIAAADRSVAVANFNVNASTTRMKDYSQLFEFVT